MSTIDDVVRVSGASRSTVYRYLAGKSIRKSSKEAIQNAIKTLNFRKDTYKVKKEYNIQIRTKKSRPSSNKKLSGIFNGSSQAMNAIVDAVAEFGGTTQLVRGNCDYDNVDGAVVMFKSIYDEDEDIKELKARGIPFVMFYRSFNDSDISFVTCDNAKASYDVTQYFIDRGHKKIGICGDIETSRNSSDKLEGYKKCLTENGIEFDEELISSGKILEDAKGWILDLIKNKKNPTAVIAVNDTYAIYIIDTIKSAGLRIPEDIAVFGMDNSDVTKIYDPSISSVAINFEELGRLAVEALVELIENPGLTGTRKYIGHNLVIRKSSEVQPDIL